MRILAKIGSYLKLNLTFWVEIPDYWIMARKIALKKSKSNPLSQLLVTATVLLMLLAAYESLTRNYVARFSPTQLFVVAAVFGILALYLKDEKI